MFWGMDLPQIEQRDQVEVLFIYTANEHEVKKYLLKENRNVA
jgi:hypothetical protein